MMSLHATAVALDGHALLITGPSGAGKSSVAAGMLGLGAVLVADDLVVVSQAGGRIRAAAPPGAVAGMEVRGWGIVPVPLAGPFPVEGVLRLEAARTRVPPPETERLLGHEVPLLRHAVSPDLPAKAVLWLRARPREAALSPDRPRS